MEQTIASRVLKEIRERLQFLADVGLGYLTLDREAASLSGGEGQRIRLATQIGSRLVGVLYVLDEPSIGLHQRDNDRLLGTLKGVRDLGHSGVGGGDARADREAPGLPDRQVPLREARDPDSGAATPRREVAQPGRCARQQPEG